jgi:hypothetical protein
MKCQRCENDKKAEFRVVSDAMNIKVCAECAKEARRIGMSLEVVEIETSKSECAASNTETRDYQGVYGERWRALVVANDVMEN